MYDLPERVLPPELLAADPSDAECIAHLAAVAARALGVVTRADLADYQRLRFGEAVKGAGEVGGSRDGQAISAAEAAAAAGLVPVEIVRRAADRRLRPGQIRPCWLTAGPGAAAGHRVTLLSPFDSLVWDRKRTLRMFGFEHSLEAYVPRAKRVHGYFTMPLLARGRLVGRVDPARSGRTLVARKLSLDRASATEAMARALAEAAAWVGCDNVELGQVEPASLEPRLRKAVSGLT